MLKRWSGRNEPVSTALLGNWADPLYDQGHLTPDALDRLKSEASVVHRQPTPVWRRKVNQPRLLLLDTPLGNGLTLYDLISGQAAQAAWQKAVARIGASYRPSPRPPGARPGGRTSCRDNPALRDLPQ